ncbi:hypothetical protein [Bacteroides cellulosilyticus]|uniref:hypothetical protein n=1 Tax=Bacteroides cellulosilyticus TaxID=246787 RepID=UPI001C3766E7|nr:hypothetical protein [Bacteroides cellulosilyticus]MBV3637706.1 hypothetical protein [Bacteroides cellulosilyticus]MBV3664047.1 hypothetical protein [Bacteroides cellulosilyticus]MBV3685949.1 hypothetical protein [Bacteroides cellulosilyticus]MBV3694626.1 hypothetical protein [Bacteroides cellulosilyticus]MBV3708246.1 hypothetical protein [Bacteroides cellulosilyticus]
MNTANIFLLITFLLVTLSSCTQEKEDNMDGIQKDTILQSVKDTCIDYRQQIIKVTTKGENWYFSTIEATNSNIEHNTDYKKQTSFPFTIEGKWFKIIRKKTNEFEIILFENQSNASREMNINLWDKNYYTCTRIFQKRR